MKDTYNLSYIVNRYKDNLSELKNVIKLKEISSHKSKIAEEDNIYNCDINLLVDALSIVKADYYRKLLIHSIPIIISVYFILSEIYYLDRNLASVRSDTYLNNINSSIYLVKTSIIFFIISPRILEFTTDSVIDHTASLVDCTVSGNGTTIDLPSEETKIATGNDPAFQ